MWMEDNPNDAAISEYLEDRFPYQLIKPQGVHLQTF